MNASPAGKRRIAAAAEQQQFGNSYSFGSGGSYSGSFGENGEIFNSGGGVGSMSDTSSSTLNRYISRLNSPVTTIAAISVSACLLIITIFAVIFAVLQVSRQILVPHKFATKAGTKAD